MSEQVVLWYTPMSKKAADNLLAMHKRAFADSGCNECPGKCCKDCATSDGYLWADDLKPGQIRYLKGKYGWDKKRGFSGATGCLLPPEKRSTTCVSFWCGQRRNSFMDGIDTPGMRARQPQRVKVLRHLIEFQDSLSVMQNYRDPDHVRLG